MQVLRWSESDKKLLPADLQAEIEDMRPHLEEQYAMLFPFLSLSKPDLFPAAVFTLDRWLWADAVFASRSFPPLLLPASPAASGAAASAGGGGKQAATSAILPSTSSEATLDDDGVLVPILDFFNHDTFGCHVDLVHKEGGGDTPGIAAVVRPGTCVVCNLNRMGWG